MKFFFGNILRQCVQSPVMLNLNLFPALLLLSTQHFVAVNWKIVSSTLSLVPASGLQMHVWAVALGHYLPNFNVALGCITQLIVLGCYNTTYCIGLYNIDLCTAIVTHNCLSLATLFFSPHRVVFRVLIQFFLQLSEAVLSHLNVYNKISLPHC